MSKLTEADLKVQDAALALKAQYQNAGIFGDGMVTDVGFGLTPPPAGPVKQQVIDVTLAEGYSPAPSECSTGYDYAGTHFKVRQWVKHTDGTRTCVSLST